MEPGPAAASSPTGSTATAASSSLIFLGTGCSAALPDTRCLIKPSGSGPPCAVCSTALSLPPDQNPNYRLNTSLLIDYCDDDGTHKYILIDCGKTFREQVLRWFVHHRVPSVDSIILTHEHADAVLGLDDVWVVQPSNGRNGFEKIPIFLTQFTMDSIAPRFPYLLSQKPEDGDEVAQGAQLEWKIIEGDVDKPFAASGLEFVPLPIPACFNAPYAPRIRRKLIECLPAAISKSDAGQLDLLILEANNLDPVSLDAIKRICPKRALLIGMRHMFEHHKVNHETLAKWSCDPHAYREGIPVQLAHDGLRIFVDL
ncbi:hypothetical protein PR202_ga20414 [Eleusine coracana subsp. coracana]|uniref:Metallo-beta-lactamase domain-containing protein n=1 Tax=Eleusine coracana subsp. coracana TaxID=191504 RepID=A0AAV5CX29_ELECO|nr:hypothetical protein PR202_ga20414 [Eleusine coracana subsp. coracana]